MATAKETYCLCGQPYNVGQFMIECDWCREWFHGSCVDVKIYQSEDIDKYHCPKCAQFYGPSLMKVPQNDHRHDRYELHSEDLPAQAGTPAFIRSLLTRAEPPPPPTSATVVTLPPSVFTEQYIKENGFNRPIFFYTSEGLDMRTPSPSSFSVRSVLEQCGADMQLDVIDVRRQTSIRMSLREFVEYYELPHDKRDGKVLNVLSLEFSDTPLSKLVWAPYVARNLDWARRCWPRNGESEDDDFDGVLRGPHLDELKKDSGLCNPRLNVQKYCLMSAAGSYTDFHVDFGGTTVWYHVLQGRKIFYLIPPTANNLALYQQWSFSATQSQCFFGDLVDWYTTNELKPGQTMFIPTGWIHAVYTPEDSLVFGGNFLHSYGIELQLQINEIESRIETPSMFRYPLFETMHWYAGVHLLQIVKRINEDTQDEDFTLKEEGGALSSSTINKIAAELPQHLLRGIRILAAALKEWNALKSTDDMKRNNIPSDINSSQLVKDLTRELRRLQRLRPTPRPSPRPAPSQIARNPLVQKLNHNKPPKAPHEEIAQKKPVKLTLPRPIMQTQIPHHNSMLHHKVTPYPSSGYDSQGSQDSYESAPYIANSQSGFEIRHDSLPMADIVKKTDSGSVLRIKFGGLSQSSVVQPLDPAYGLPPDEHSILKSHLTSKAKPSNLWTISKKECEDDHTVLFTNEAITIPKINMLIQTKDVVIPNQAAILSGQTVDEYSTFIEERKSMALPDYSPINYPQPQHKLEPIVYSPEGSPYMPGEKLHSRPTYGANGSFQLESKSDHNQSAMIYSYAKARFKNDENSYGGSLKIEPSLPEYPQTPYGVIEAVDESLRLANNFPMSTPTSAQTSDRRRSARAPRRRPLSPSYHYDVTDGDLCIDEDRPVRRRPKAPNVKKSPLKMRIPAHLFKATDQGQFPNASLPPLPTNGIESLLQASALAAESVDQECEAVEGMLSISQYPPTYTDGIQRPPVDASTPQAQNPAGRLPSTPPNHSVRASFGLASITSPLANDRTPRRSMQALRPESPELADPDEEAKLIKEVHRDEEFVYPSLELSSDDEDYPGNGAGTSSRNRNRLGHDRISKHDRDESWSPRARLGRLLPKLNRPARPGVRREAVRKALQAASVTNTPSPAAAPQPVPQASPQLNHIPVRKPIKKKPPARPVQPITPPAVVTSPTNNNKAKMKKGMKTVKQRLGKILKLHKMIY